VEFGIVSVFFKMKKILVLLSFCFFTSFSIFGQRQIVKKSIVSFLTPPAKIQAWQDESGYILTVIQERRNHYLSLVHREKGIISEFESGFTILESLGFTSTPVHFTLYFQGYVGGKKDYYFVAFSKDGKTKPVMTQWMNTAGHGKHILRYSAYDKLFLFKSDKENLTVVEVDDYDKVKTTVD